MHKINFDWSDPARPRYSRRVVSLLRLLVIVLATFALTGMASAEFVVAPNNLANAEGDTNNAAPFSDTPAFESMRYQQVYAASEFAASSGPQQITQIAFRPDGVFGGPFSETLPNVQLNLSTTQSGPSALSSFFAENVGPDDTIVHSGPMPLSSAASGTAGGPYDFDIVIDLQPPFVYDPAMGNLLLDVRNFVTVRTDVFDATAISTSLTTRVYALDVNAVFANGEGPDLALVTRFTVVPEPSALVLVLVCVVPCHRKRRRYKVGLT